MVIASPHLRQFGVGGLRASVSEDAAEGEAVLTFGNERRGILDFLWIPQADLFAEAKKEQEQSKKETMQKQRMSSSALWVTVVKVSPRQRLLGEKGEE